MMEDAGLTKREAEVAELFAWGASKKDVAAQLYISERTVENHARNIYTKIRVSKVNELCAWWFCTHFHISFELSPLRRKIFAMMMLAILIPTMAGLDQRDMMRPNARTSTARGIRARRSHEDADTDIQFIF